MWFQVQKKCKEALSTGAEWEKIVREVLTDEMLEMEGLEPTKALEFIFQQGFTYFPVSEQGRKAIVSLFVKIENQFARL